MTRRVSSGLARVMNSVIVTPGELADRRSPQPAAFRDRPHPHTGSPPRAWGAHRSGRRHAPRQRLTPTGVGSTRSQTPSPPPRPAHPHGRGEHLISHAPRSRNGGSPPTGVGSTAPRRPGRLGRAAHPHGRGEHVSTTSGILASSGSPPRPWGALQRPPDRQHRVRLTPTGVGSTPDLARKTGG